MGNQDDNNETKGKTKETDSSGEVRFSKKDVKTTGEPSELQHGKEKKENDHLLDKWIFSFDSMKDLGKCLDPLTTCGDQSSLFNDTNTVESLIKLDPNGSEIDQAVGLMDNPSLYSIDSLNDPLANIAFTDGSPLSLSTESSNNKEGSDKSIISSIGNRMEIGNTLSAEYEDALDTDLLPLAHSLISDLTENTSKEDPLRSLTSDHDILNQGQEHVVLQDFDPGPYRTQINTLSHSEDEDTDGTGTDPLQHDYVNCALGVTGATNDESGSTEIKDNAIGTGGPAKPKTRSSEPITAKKVQAAKSSKGKDEKNKSENSMSKEVEADADALQKKPQKRKQAKFLKPIPSRYCHICARTPKTVRNVVCAKMKTGYCRKVVCERCFNDYGWDWKAANEPTSNWICPHCVGKCPKRAQCHTYSKTNNRLRVKRIIEKKTLRNAKRRPQPCAPSLILPATAKIDPMAAAPWIMHNILAPQLDPHMTHSAVTEKAVTDTSEPQNVQATSQDEKALENLNISAFLDALVNPFETPSPNLLLFPTPPLAASIETDLESS